MSSITWRGWSVLVVTYLAYVSIYCARKPFSVVKSVVEKDLSLSPQQLAAIDTALLTMYAAGQLSLGILVKPLGRTWTLVLAFALAGAATTAFGAAGGAAQMLCLWAAAGAFASPASPLFSIVVQESVPEQVRATVVGLWSSCENLGGVFANLVAARVLSSHGWRTAFYVSGALVAVWAPLLLIVLPVPADSSKAGGKASGASAKGAGTQSTPSALSVKGVGAAAFCYTLTKSARCTYASRQQPRDRPAFLSALCPLPLPSALPVSHTSDGATPRERPQVLPDVLAPLLPLDIRAARRIRGWLRRGAARHVL